MVNRFETPFYFAWLVWERRARSRQIATTESSNGRVNWAKPCERNMGPETTSYSIDSESVGSLTSKKPCILVSVSRSQNCKNNNGHSSCYFDIKALVRFYCLCTRANSVDSLDELRIVHLYKFILWIQDRDWNVRKSPHHKHKKL